MSNEQPHIYLGRIDGKLWLAGPTDQTVPNDYDSEQGILSSADRWKSIFHLPRIEYLGQETDFQPYQAVREGVDFAFRYYCCTYDYNWVVCDRQCAQTSRKVAIAKEPAATIQAIREATNRNTQSPEAAREFLQEAGIEPTSRVEFDDTPLMENNQTELTPEAVLRMHFPLMDDEGSNFKRFYFNDAVAAMQEYADLRTAELSAKVDSLEYRAEEADHLEEELDTSKKASKEWCEKAMEAAQHRRELQSSIAAKDNEIASLQAEKAELVEALNGYRKQLADELAACEAKLNELSPLGRHALQAPIKAQIALLKDLLSKHTK